MTREQIENELVLARQYSDTLHDAAKALLDWALEHTSPRDANSPHELLIALASALKP